MKKKFSIYQTVTDKIIEMLKKGLDGKRERPWTCNKNSGLPRNLKANPYNGINFLLLQCEMLIQGYPTNVWGTLKAWNEKGAKVTKGEKSTLVTFWKPIEKEDPNDNYLLIRYFTVFNASQVESVEKGKDHKAVLDGKFQGWEAHPIEERLEAAEQAASGYFSRESGLGMNHGSTKAFYAPHQDKVVMPSAEDFKDLETYYSVLFHELTHSTGHEKRLDRKLRNKFGDEAYAFEELVAELGAAMLCASLGIEDEPREDHAKYLKSWLTVLEGDNRAIFSASSLAQKAVKYIVPELDNNGKLEKAA